jgi:hypothetical protein
LAGGGGIGWHGRPARIAVTVTSESPAGTRKGEQLATFIVDLGEDLKSELDLESLGRSTNGLA